MLLVSKTRMIGKRPNQASNPSLIGAITDAGLTSNLKLCLDAGDSNSYSGGTKWSDVSGNGYDFFLGADGSAAADDPTFNGSYNGLSSNEYFSFDGGDFFRYETSNETWMENIHKNGAIFSLLVARWSDGTLYIGDTGGVSNTGFHTTTTNLNLHQVRNAGATPFSKTADNVLSSGAWNIVGVSIDENGGASAGFFYLNGAYNPSSAANTWNPAYTSPAAGAASFTMEIGARGNGANKAASGSRIAWLAMWEGTALSKANFDTLYAALAPRLGLS